MKKFFVLLALVSIYATGAFAGDKVLNGGDLCEDRFQQVRDDLHLWIQKGGASALQLPSGVTLDQYTAKMTQAIGAAHVSCTSTPVMVGEAEKTCENFTDSAGAERIICNASGFQALTPSDQYVLVHHEYAGLAGLEVNDGESSQYSLSNQISGSLGDEVVKHLIVKGDDHLVERLQKGFGPYLGYYTMIDCHENSQIGLWKTFCSQPLVQLTIDAAADPADTGFAIVFRRHSKSLATALFAAMAPCLISDGKADCGHSQELTITKIGGYTFLEYEQVYLDAKKKPTYNRVSLTLKKM